MALRAHAFDEEIARRARRYAARMATAVIVFALTATTAVGADTLLPWSGGPVPLLKLKTLEGRALSLESFRGRTVVVNFWATWCVPCLIEMPSLQRLRDRLAPDGVEVLAVNLKEDAARVAPFVERLGITFPVLRDRDGAASEAWRVNVFPTSFVVGPDQRIAWYVRGAVDWDDSRIEAQVRSTINRARPPAVYGIFVAQ